MSAVPHWLSQVSFNEAGLIPAIAQDHATGRILMMAWMNQEALTLTAQSKTAVYYSRSRGKLWHKGETSGNTQTVHDIRLDCDADVIVLSVTQHGGVACHTGRPSCFYRLLNMDGDTPTWQITDAVIKDPAQMYGSQMHISMTASAQHPDEPTAPDMQPDTQSDTPSEAQTAAQAPNTTKRPPAPAPSAAHILSQLDQILTERKSASKDSSYVASLYAKGINKILEKVGEEATETLIAAKDYQLAMTAMTASDNTDHKLASSKNDLIYEIADLWFHTMVTLAWFDMDSSLVTGELARRFGLSGLEEKAARTAQ